MLYRCIYVPNKPSLLLLLLVLIHDLLVPSYTNAETCNAPTIKQITYIIVKLIRAVVLILN